MNRQNQIRKTITKLKAQVAAGKEALATAEARAAAAETGQPVNCGGYIEYGGEKWWAAHLLRAAETKLAETERERDGLKGALDEEVRSWHLRDNQAVAERDRLTARLAGVEQELDSLRVQELDTRKLRRRLQDRGEEIIQLAQRVRELEKALTAKEKEDVIEAFNKRHGGTP